MTDKAIPIFQSRDLVVAASSLGRIGFRETARYDGYTVLERGNIELHYAANREHDPFTEARTAYVRVDDVEAMYADVLDAGFERWDEMNPRPDLRTRWERRESIARVSALEVKPWGFREFALLDEDNNLLRIGQRIASA
jgi:hypothetical protein